MEKREVNHGNGRFSSDNYMLDDVIDIVENNGIINDGSNDKLIKELTIKTIEYGRRNLYSIMSFKSVSEDIFIFCRESDSVLQKKIIELGGTPSEINNKFHNGWTTVEKNKTNQSQNN